MLEQAVFHAIGLVHMFLRENGRACGNASDQGQKQLGCLLQGLAKCCPRAALMALTVSLRRRIPREVPLSSSMTPFRANACKCSSAAFADLKSQALSQFLPVWVGHRFALLRAGSSPESAAAGP